MTLTLRGDQFFSKADAAVVNGIAHVMQLDSAASELTWAVYGFGGLAADTGLQDLSLTLQQDAPHGIWVGLADFAAGRWQWQWVTPNPTVAVINLAGNAGLVNAAGACYCAVGEWDGGGTGVQSLQLACDPQDLAPLGIWPMLGHDARHSGRSPYLGPEVPELKWSLSIGGIYQGLVIDNDGVVYSGSADGLLTAVSPEGVIQWQFTAPDGILHSPAIGADGTVFFTCNDHLLYALNPDGSLRWTYDMEYLIHSDPVVGTDGRLYVCGSNGLHCFIADGAVQWIAAGISEQTPAVALDGTIYASGSNGGLYCFNPDGSVKWNCKSVVYNDHVISISPTGTAYCGFYSVPPPGLEGEPHSALYAVDSSGQLQWTIEDAMIYRVAGFAGDGTAYSPSGRSFYAVGTDSAVTWTVADLECSAPALAIDASGTLYFGITGSGGISGGLVALNPDGTFKWTWEAPANIPYAPVVISTGQTLYAADEDGHLLAIGPKSQ